MTFGRLSVPVWIFGGLFVGVFGISGCSSEDFPLNPLDPSTVNSDDSESNEVACRDDDRARTSLDSDSAISTNASCSHNAGRECVSCHVAGSGSEASEYAFTIAGSVFTNSSGSTALTNSSAVIRLYTDNQTTNLVLTLPVDQTGNFYTTQSVPTLSSGLYPVIERNNQVYKMSSQHTTTGNCYSCHSSGGSQSVIYAPN